MDNKIVSQLVQHNNDYKEKYEDFAFKHDITQVTAFEEKHYLKPLLEKIVPIIAQHIQDFSFESVDDYFPYLWKKYHDNFSKAVQKCIRENENYCATISKEIIEDFTKTALLYNLRPEEDQKKYIFDFVNKHKTYLKTIAREEPGIALQTIAGLRNPKMQYLIINKLDNTLQQNLKEYIRSLDSDIFKNVVEKTMCYPRNYSIDEYYGKWIGKDRIHIKCTKALLGERYEDGKTIIKALEKQQQNEKNNALPPDVHDKNIVRRPLTL